MRSIVRSIIQLDIKKKKKKGTAAYAIGAARAVAGAIGSAAIKGISGLVFSLISFSALSRSI